MHLASTLDTLRMVHRAIGTSSEATIVRLMVVCLGIELLVFGWLMSLGHEAFIQFIWTPDTPTYAIVAEELAERLTLTAGSRTLGYPLVLAAGHFIAGHDHAPHAVIVIQLILNLGFTWGCWRLLEQLAPAAGVRLRAAATLFFFWAGLGMALYLMTDFMAALLFAVFLYGLLFWRSRSGLAISGAALMMATLTRPTFTLLPLLLPIAGWLVGRCTSRVPRYYVLALTVCSLSATTLSVTYQYTFAKYLGPAPFLLTPITETLYRAIIEGRVAGIDYSAYTEQFKQNIAQRASRPYASLSAGERDDYAKQIFREELIAHPKEILFTLVESFMKYLFAPVESVVSRIMQIYGSETAYFLYVRPILGLLCLPVWCFSFSPPFRGPRRYWMYYLMVMMWLAYVVGLSSIGIGQGERYRFAVLVFMLPVTIWNVQALQTVLRGSTIARHSGGQQSVTAPVRFS